MTKDTLQQVLDAVNRAGIGHNNKAGGQWLLVSTDDQLVALRAALTATTNEAAAQAEGRAEPMARFCPGCGSVGPVPEKYRDCCPDGNEARLIPARLADKCNSLFKAALSNALATQPVQAQGEAAPWVAEPVRGEWRGNSHLRWTNPAPNASVPMAPNCVTSTVEVSAAPAVDRGLSEAQEREAFEDFARNNRQSIDRFGNAGYRAGDTQLMWGAWRARAALAASAPRQAEPRIVYSPIECSPHAEKDGRHPNDDEPFDPEARQYLNQRGDDAGQGLSIYWKWGYRAGWADHKRHAAPSQAGSCQASGYWAAVEVNPVFPALVEALDRAARKGYMPDAMTAEWEAFEYRLPFSGEVTTPPAGRTLTAEEEGVLQHLRNAISWLRDGKNIGNGVGLGDFITLERWLAASSTTAGERG